MSTRRKPGTSLKGNAMPEEFDFLRTLEEALNTIEDLADDPKRIQIMPSGESGLLEVEFENGRKYTIQFNPSEE